MGQTDFGIAHGRRDTASCHGSIPSASQPTKPGSAWTCVNWIEFDSIALHFSNLAPVSVKNAALEVGNRTDPDQLAQVMAGLQRGLAQSASHGERARRRMRDEFSVVAVTASYEVLHAAARAGKAVT